VAARTERKGEQTVASDNGPIRATDHQNSSVTVNPCAFDGQRCRRDGLERRAAVLAAALRLFSARGFDNTSMREIAMAAQSHLASIYYYFGDKSNLYRCAVNEPLASCLSEGYPFDLPGLTLREGLGRFFSMRLLPFSASEDVRLAWRLHHRERLFPSGAMASVNVEPSARTRLFDFLSRHCSKRVTSSMVMLLAISISAIADEVCSVELQEADGTSRTPVQELAARLTALAEGMVAAADATLWIQGTPDA
jgi:AcrR family transcriptional regulator